MINYIFLNRYEEHPDAALDKTLLWDYDLARFDFQKMRNVVVARVIERGWPNDWYATLHMYGEEGVRDAIRNIPYLEDRDMIFASRAMDVPLEEMKCYIREQSEGRSLADILEGINNPVCMPSKDIAAMKLNAIVNNGTRLKDFIDVAYLSGYFSLSEMIGFYEAKYAKRNPFSVIKAIEYQHDIDFNEPIQMIKGEFTWEKIQKRLDQMTKAPEKKFSQLS